MRQRSPPDGSAKRTQERGVRQQRTTNDERGQVIVFVVLGMVVLIGMAGLVVDVGYAYWSQRSLQASTDAAALAGAQALPNRVQAEADAIAFGGGEGGANAQPNLPGVKTVPTTRCLASAPNCAPVNAIKVTETTTVHTIFSRVFG